MKIKALITGSTGMIGKGVLFECLDDPEVASVYVINRHPLNIEHEKLTEIIHHDLSDISPIVSQLPNINTCFFCLGVSSAGMSEEQYHKITHDLTLHVAKTLSDLNKNLTFIYISGAGTDGSEKGRSMWARVKGKTENALLSLPFKDAYMFRPAFIQPLRGIKSRTKSYNLLYAIFKPFYPLLKHFPKYVTNTEKLGKAMIKVAKEGHQKKILENIDINEVMK